MIIIILFGFVCESILVIVLFAKKVNIYVFEYISSLFI